MTEWHKEFSRQYGDGKNKVVYWIKRNKEAKTVEEKVHRIIWNEYDGQKTVFILWVNDRLFDDHVPKPDTQTQADLILDKVLDQSKAKPKAHY